MRPHVEMIHEDDYIWHPAELPGGNGEALEQRLAIDEEDGSSSLMLSFPTDWSRGAGVPHADTEFFVVEGSMTYDGQTMGKWEYIHVPKGVPMAELAIAKGSRILHWREYGPADFDLGGSRTADASGDVTITNPADLEWTSTLERTPGPMTPLYIKMLHHNKETDFYTRLIKAPKGWTEDRLPFHPVFEEFFTLEGCTASVHGDNSVGTYAFRPAWIKHGHYDAVEDTIWILRCDGVLVNLYATDTWIKWGQTPGNYEPADLPHGGPLPSTMPVRSRTVGPWDPTLA